MDRPMPHFSFKVMTFMFKMRDLFSPRKNVLAEVGIESGFTVLDYGCGPGSYIIPLSRLVGPEGKIHALDIHQLAVKKVQKIAKKRNLENVNTILSDCDTGLPGESVDRILLYDILHDLGSPKEVLKELNRVLGNDGLLSVSDHHLSREQITHEITEEGLFELSNSGKKTLNFTKTAT